MHKMWLILCCFTLPMYAMHKSFMPDHLAPHDTEKITSISWHHTSQTALTAGTMVSPIASCSSPEPASRKNKLTFSRFRFEYDIDRWRDVVPPQNNDGHLHELAILIALKSKFPTYSLETIMSLLPPNALEGARIYIGQEVQEIKLRQPNFKRNEFEASKNFPATEATPFGYNDLIFSKVLTKHRKLPNLVSLYKDLEEAQPAVKKLKELIEYLNTQKDETGKTRSLPSSSSGKPFLNWLAEYLKPQPSKPDEADQDTCTQSSLPKPATPKVPNLNLAGIKHGRSKNAIKPPQKSDIKFSKNSKEENLHGESKKPAPNPKDPAPDQKAALRKYLEAGEKLNDFENPTSAPNPLKKPEQDQQKTPQCIQDEKQKARRQKNDETILRDAFYYGCMVFDRKGSLLPLLSAEKISYKKLLNPERGEYYFTLLAYTAEIKKPEWLEARIDCIKNQMRELKLSEEQIAKVWQTELLAQSSSKLNPLGIAHNLLEQVLAYIDRYSEHKQPLEKIIALLQPLYKKYCPEELEEIELKQQQEKLFFAIKNNSLEPLESLQLSHKKLLNPAKNDYDRTLLAQAAREMKPKWLEAWLDCIQKQINRLKLTSERDRGFG